MGYPIRNEARKMPDSKAKREWGKNNMLLIGVKLHRTKDADIIEFLDRSEDKQNNVTRQTTIKLALREYMENHKEGKMKTYKIKPEFLSAWGSDTTEETIITEAEIVRLSSEWGVSVDDLMEQLEEIE